MIASSVTNIGDHAFAYCSNLHQAFFQGNAPSVNGGAGSADSTVFHGGIRHGVLLAGHHGLGRHLRRLAHGMDGISPSRKSSDPVMAWARRAMDFNSRFPGPPTRPWWWKPPPICRTGRRSSPTRWSTAPMLLRIQPGPTIRSGSTGSALHRM